MQGLEFTLPTIAMVIFAGLTSVASPCVLPVIPIIVTGTEQDHRHRPLLIVMGLSASFMAMGVISSLFGSAIAGIMPLLEKGAGVIIILFGVLMLLDINPFKKLSLLSNIHSTSKGRWSGLTLGLTLGLVWIPCVGPMLSGVLTLVATKASLFSGLILLAFYSLGFAVPMLVAGYASQTFRQKKYIFQTNPKVIRVISGLLLIAFGCFILQAGMISIGSLI
ncbi:MAG: cytochrome c biogenesis CcdA family protein [Desulfobulbaceae bacterium]|nr:cytochrome c biogenesis CcdA family protein [Desulfobulbaceae bacterium]